MSQGEGRVRSGLRRNLRVWRYLGQSTPSGWIGLKGTSRVGMQKELEAMLDIDLYTQETVMVGENLAAGVGRGSDRRGPVESRRVAARRRIKTATSAASTRRARADPWAP